MNKHTKSIKAGDLITNTLDMPYNFMLYTPDMDLSNGLSRPKIKRILIQPNAVGIVIKTNSALFVVLFDDVMVTVFPDWCKLL